MKQNTGLSKTGGKQSIENTSPKEKPLTFCTWNRNLMNSPLILTSHQGLEMI